MNLKRQNFRSHHIPPGCLNLELPIARPPCLRPPGAVAHPQVQNWHTPLATTSSSMQSSLSGVLRSFLIENVWTQWQHVGMQENYFCCCHVSCLYHFCQNTYLSWNNVNSPFEALSSPALWPALDFLQLKSFTHKDYCDFSFTISFVFQRSSG